MVPTLPAIDGKVDRVTALRVNLVDVEMLKRGEKKSRDMHYSSFAHSFVIALMRGGSRLRSWEDAKAFPKMFQKLCRFQLCDELNAAYHKCFEVDINSVCGRGTLQPTIARLYRTWVRIFEINDVKVENFQKFVWEG
ncbi:hypothetical protein BDV26DRAFT_285136 [Aspergillus bertholletiae]|uniref:Uncharacterized protein n=1 Tax=Aspergillus bertholletiae TaxID=1226010 RepID=A0A5N7AX77_9EURO|nr:hypothetical protein BDV26DRAFT_285136 [Aspergillus bertholletiae]